MLVLHDMEDLSTAEVAQVTGLQPGTVRVRLHRARLFVRRHLARLAKGEKLPGLEIHASAEESRPQHCRSLFAALSDYMDGVVDDAVCEEMDRHIHDCVPCQAFLSSLKQAVSECQAYQPEAKPVHAEALRRELAAKYHEAVSALGVM